MTARRAPSSSGTASVPEVTRPELGYLVRRETVVPDSRLWVALRVRKPPHLQSQRRILCRPGDLHGDHYSDPRRARQPWAHSAADHGRRVCRSRCAHPDRHAPGRTPANLRPTQVPPVAAIQLAPRAWSGRSPWPPGGRTGPVLACEPDRVRIVDMHVGEHVKHLLQRARPSSQV